MRIKKFNESNNSIEKVKQDFADIYHQLSDINHTMDLFIDDKEFYCFDDNYKKQQIHIQTGYIGNRYMINMPDLAKAKGISYTDFTTYYESLTQIKYILDVYKNDYIICNMKLERGNPPFSEDYFGFYIISKTVKI